MPNIEKSLIVRIGLVVGACLALAWGDPAAARELNPAAWKFSGANATDMKKAVDDDLGTLWESDGPQTPGSGIVVDLGQDAYVYGLFLTSGKELSKFPRSLKISVGETVEKLEPAGASGVAAEAKVNIMNPGKGKEGRKDDE
jgi:hypothetical protein